MKFEIWRVINSPLLLDVHICIWSKLWCWSKSRSNIGDKIFIHGLSFIQFDVRLYFNINKNIQYNLLIFITVDETRADARVDGLVRVNAYFFWSDEWFGKSIYGLYPNSLLGFTLTYAGRVIKNKLSLHNIFYEEHINILV